MVTWLLILVIENILLFGLLTLHSASTRMEWFWLLIHHLFFGQGNSVKMRHFSYVENPIASYFWHLEIPINEKSWQYSVGINKASMKSAWCFLQSRHFYFLPSTWINNFGHHFQLNNWQNYFLTIQSSISKRASLNQLKSCYLISIDLVRSSQSNF